MPDEPIAKPDDPWAFVVATPITLESIKGGMDRWKREHARSLGHPTLLFDLKYVEVVDAG